MMVKVNKRPIVIQDLIEQATYISQDNLDASDRFLMAEEETFNLLRILQIPSGETSPKDLSV